MASIVVSKLIANGADAKTVAAVKRGEVAKAPAKKWWED